MAGNLTGVAAMAALDYLTGKSLDLGTAVQTMQLALLTAAPPNNPAMSDLNEVASTGYARQNVTWGLATDPTPGQPAQITTTANILYGPFTDVSGLAFPATHCALIGKNASNASTVLMVWQFDAMGQAAQNESLQISAGSLTMTLG